MKVYLLNPPAVNGMKMVREGRCMQRKGAWTTVWPPISLASCASLLIEKGFEVKLNDCIVEDIDIEGMKTIVAEFKPDLVVINTATASIENDLAIARHVKEVWRHARTAVIGIHVSVLPDDCLKMETALDYIIRGEPEWTTAELSAAIRGDKDLSKIDGISCRIDDKIVHNKDRKFIEDLDILPFPAWHLIRPENYPLPFSNKPFLLVTTSKGCPHNCVFCPAKPYYGRKVRLRSPQKVVDEMEWVKECFNVDEFLIWSESFTHNKDFAHSICDEILQRNLKIRWVCNSRVDTIDLDLLTKFREAGCWMIGYGVESGNQEVLNKSRKGVTIEQTRKAVKWAQKAGLEVTAHVIFGLPGETSHTANQTITFIKELDVEFAQFYCAVPWPSTDLYVAARKEGWLKTTDWSMLEQNYSVLNYQTITAEEIMQFRRKAIRQFYLRPKTVYRTLRRIRGPKEAKNFAKMLWEFKTWI